MADYGKAVELKADFALALAGLGKLQARQGEYATAAANYQKACELAPNDMDALYNYGICLVNLGRNAEARLIFEKVLAIDAAHADAATSSASSSSAWATWPRPRNACSRS